MSQLSEARMRALIEVERYEGGNEYLEAVREDEPIFICQGPAGRVPIIADTAEEALERYLARYAEKFEERLEEN